MATLELNIADMAKIVERIRIDHPTSPTLDTRIVEGLLNFMQTKEMERRQKAALPSLIIPGRMQ